MSSILACVGTVTVTDDQKGQERRLRRSQREPASTAALLYALQTAAPVGLAFVDRQFRKLRVNQVLAKLTGLPVEDQLGRPAGEITPDLWPKLELIWKGCSPPTWTPWCTARASQRGRARDHQAALPTGPRHRRPIITWTRAHPKEHHVEYRTLGRTGVLVSKLCLGAMMFGPWGNPDHDEALRTIHRALDAGIDFIDTADIYSRCESEEIVGKALAGGRRDNIVLATKFHNPMGQDPNERGNSRRWIVRAVEASLRRLGTDRIDLYQVHRPSANTDIEETLGALTDLVHQGKVLYIGSSTFPGSQIVEAQWVSRDQNLQRFVCEQAPYSLLARAVENDVLPTAARHGMGVITYSPLTGGWLSGRWREGAELPTPSPSRQRLVARFDMSLPANQRKLEAADALGRLADEAGMSLIEMAIAFVLRHPAVTAAIIGPRTVGHLESQLPAADVTLDTALLDRIDGIVTPGVNINPADGSFANPDLEPGARRR